MHWFAQAPANIALIKYMGKKETASNLPDNSSLSYTLDHLLSTVRLESIMGDEDRWEPLISKENPEALVLSTSGQQRFIAHLQRLKQYFGYSGSFLIQSTNNFPHGSGLASSASSFAALTRCAAMALSELTDKPLPLVAEQAQLSRMGSGSSCRSFFSPWALWQEEAVFEVVLPYSHLLHQVVVISEKEKAVSSSEAHQRVKSSALYQARPARAEARLKDLLAAFEAQNWPLIYQLCWDDFQEMHQLFSSCEQPFAYITEQSLQVLNKLTALWQERGDGPIVTMDAGPNIHLLYRDDQQDMAQQFYVEHLKGTFHVL
ncbi:MAG: diphosphomevalonate decarboxylase [Legionella sp.]|nr:MAG: diphosphomevalonate decarboxylase [Legionella sp.]PJD98611.1 MAG: diphosphomevalonate decarboxylase [Legionella sp.]